MSTYSRTFAVIISLLPLASCDLYRRTSTLEREVSILRDTIDSNEKRVRELALEVRGKSTTVVLIPGDGQARALFGNQSGKNARVSALHQSKATDLKLEVLVHRIPRPSDETRDNSSPEKENNRLPVDYERTLWVDMSAPGSRRQLSVPPGFEIIAKCTGSKASVSLLIIYE